MKLRLRFSAPRLDDGTALPAALAALLAVLLVVQFAMTSDPETPAEAVGRVQPLTEVGVPPSAEGSPVILARPLFAPNRRFGGGGTAGPGGGDPAVLGGAVVAGTVSRGGAQQAFLKLPDGTIRVMAPGGSFQGWRLVRLTAEGARFARAGEVVTLAFGSAGAAKPPASDDEEESTDE